MPVLTDILNTNNDRIPQHQEPIHLAPKTMAAAIATPLRLNEKEGPTARPSIALPEEGPPVGARLVVAYRSIGSCGYDPPGVSSPGFRPTPPPRFKVVVTTANTWIDVGLEVKATAPPPMTEAELLARNHELTQLYILLKAHQRALYSRLDILGHELVTSWSQERMKERAMVLSGGKPELERRTLEAFQQGRARKLQEQKAAWDELQRIQGRFAEYERERDFIDAHLRV